MVFLASPKTVELLFCSFASRWLSSLINYLLNFNRIFRGAKLFHHRPLMTTAAVIEGDGSLNEVKFELKHWFSYLNQTFWVDKLMHVFYYHFLKTNDPKKKKKNNSEMAVWSKSQQKPLRAWFSLRYQYELKRKSLEVFEWNTLLWSCIFEVILTDIYLYLKLVHSMWFSINFLK